MLRVAQAKLRTEFNMGASRERKMERRCAEKKRREGRIEEREFSLYSLEEQRKNKEN